MRRGSVLTALAALAVVLALALPLAGSFRQPGAPMEEGKLLTAAELVLDGLVPHEDFEHFYGPADVWAVAVAFAAAGRSVDVERAAGLAYVIVLVCAVFGIARRLGRVPAAGAAVLAGWLLAPFGVHAYSWTAGLAFLLLGVHLGLTAANRTGRAGTLLAAGAGAAAGLALLYRADLVVAVALVLAALWPRLTASQRLAGLAGALLTCVVPYAAHLAMAGFDDVWRGMVVDSLVRLRDGRALPVPPPGDALTAWLDLSAPEPPPSRFLPDPTRAFQLRAFFWITALAVLVSVAAGAVAWARDRASADTAWTLCVAAVAVGVVPQMLQRADATHVRFVACVVLPLAPLAAVAAASMFDRRLPRSAAATELLALGAAAVLLAVPFYTARLAVATTSRAVGRVATAEVGIDGREFPVVDALAPDAAALLARMESVPPGRGRLFVGPQDLELANYSDAFLYFLLGERFRPASFYLESNPGIANAPDSRLARDLAGADVLVLSSEYDNWDEPNASRTRGPGTAAKVVADAFCPVDELGRYRVLVRCP